MLFLLSSACQALHGPARIDHLVDCRWTSECQLIGDVVGEPVAVGRVLDAATE